MFLSINCLNRYNVFDFKVLFCKIGLIEWFVYFIDYLFVYMFQRIYLFVHRLLYSPSRLVDTWGQTLFGINTAFLVSIFLQGILLCYLKKIYRPLQKLVLLQNHFFVFLPLVKFLRSSWLFHDYSMIIPWLFHDYSMIIPWLFLDYSKRFPSLYLYDNIKLFNRRVYKTNPTPMRNVLTIHCILRVSFSDSFLGAQASTTTSKW